METDRTARNGGSDDDDLSKSSTQVAVKARVDDDDHADDHDSDGRAVGDCLRIWRALCPEPELWHWDAVFWRHRLQIYMRAVNFTSLVPHPPTANFATPRVRF